MPVDRATPIIINNNYVHTPKCMYPWGRDLRNVEVVDLLRRLHFDGMLSRIPCDIKESEPNMPS